MEREKRMIPLHHIYILKRPLDTSTPLEGGGKNIKKKKT